MNNYIKFTSITEFLSITASKYSIGNQPRVIPRANPINFLH